MRRPTIVGQFAHRGFWPRVWSRLWLPAVPTYSTSNWTKNREALGFLVSTAFVVLAAIRDVVLGGLVQRASPLFVATTAFTLCTLLLLPIAFVRSRDSLATLLRRPRDLFWVNVASMLAYLAFLFALKFIEPTLVQILYSGIGPLSVLWIENRFSPAHRRTPISPRERRVYVGLLATLLFAASVALLGFSGTGRLPPAVAAGGVVLGVGGGIAVSVATMLCRRLNDHGVSAGALLALRFPGTAVVAAVLEWLSPDAALPLPASLDYLLLIALLLIVTASYVNQFAISLASPLTVRVVLASGPVLIFLFQLIEGRLSASPYTLTAAVLYAVAAITAGIARQRAIQTKASTG